MLRALVEINIRASSLNLRRVRGKDNLQVRIKGEGMPPQTMNFKDLKSGENEVEHNDQAVE